MTILAIDTSARRRVVAVLANSDGTLITAELHDDARADATLPAALQRLIAQQRPSAVVAVTGPGSYTGLRAGLAAALGLAHALGIPLHGAGALEVVAAAHDRTVVAVSDAGRGGLYVAEAPFTEPRRTDAATWHATEGAVSLDAVPGTVPGDPATGLARAAAAAVRRAPLQRHGLAARYV